MLYEGYARLDKRTKNLIKRLKSTDVAIISHDDLDKVSAEMLVESKVKVVVNARPSISGCYPNSGPIILCSAGIHLIDNVGEAIFDKLRSGSKIKIEDNKIYKKDELIATGELLTPVLIKEKMEKAKEGMSEVLEEFALNTIEFMQKEKDYVLKGVKVPETLVDFNGRHALIVVRGYDYKDDLKMLSSYIKEVKPVLIGVDGGADALMQFGFKPDIIVGDMDSVTDEALLSGAEIIVHAYPDGRSPGLERIKSLYLSPIIFQAPGTSEDVAMLLAYEKEAELIVAVGTHANLIEFLDKGRKGMASTFLVRLKVGNKLVDAKGVSKLYRSSVQVSYLAIMLLAALVTVAIIILVSPPIKHLIKLTVLSLRVKLGI
ncbi:MAG: hypothetical protein HY776_07595 [Actinobacteria bacterium]|nr:hypothetical protein [Actinomycetota bacterium]